MVIETVLMMPCHAVEEETDSRSTSDGLAVEALMCISISGSSSEEYRAALAVVCWMELNELIQ